MLYLMNGICGYNAGSPNQGQCRQQGKPVLSAAIFISYAHVDNQPVHGQEQGWISHFIHNLGNETARAMGRSENYSLWMDFKLNTNDAVTPEIEQQLREADILLIMMSKGWLASQWCVRELEYFSKVHGDLGKRVFVVNQGGLAREEQPEILHDLLGIPFYDETPQGKLRQLGYPVPQTSDKEYFFRVVDLADQLATSLKLFASAQYQGMPETIEYKATVYVAPVNDSLFDQRSQLVSELTQFGIRSLPACNRFEADMDKTLRQCSHFIQLLDTNFALGIPQNQHLTAQTADVPILQWRHPELDVGKANHEQKALLKGEAVIACELPDFIRQVREAVLPKLPPPPPQPLVNGNKMVFVHASPEDFPKAEEVAATLQERGFGIALPRYEGDAQRIRKSIERGYQYCDVLLMLQQRASADLVEDYLAELEVYAKKSPTVLLCQCKKAEKLYFIPPLMKILHCNDRFEADCLEQFLAMEVSA